MNQEPLWIDPGRRFGFDDLVWWQRHEGEGFAQAASRFDTIVLAPHAGAAFPAELQPFIAPALTLRKQCDYSDLITADLARAWAAADPHVVCVANPASRLVLDPNRTPPADPLGGLQEFYRRLERLRRGEAVGFAGVDAIRPVTFAGETVLQEPGSPAGWRALGDALRSAAARTVERYLACAAEVVDTVVRARAGRAPLLVVSLHDTMNTRMRADGAIVVERAPADRLPRWVNLGNRGDAQGEFAGEPLTLDAASLRRLAAAWSDALGLDTTARESDVLLNRPYKGAFETIHHGARLRVPGTPGVGAVQAEFLRETLLGPAAVEHLMRPGSDWPAVDDAHIGRIAAALAEGGRALRAA